MWGSLPVGGQQAGAQLRPSNTLACVRQAGPSAESARAAAAAVPAPGSCLRLQRNLDRLQIRPCNTPPSSCYSECQKEKNSVVT